jgi:outer membrane lipoprotein-sorting protein
MKPADDIKRYFRNATLSTNSQVHERVFADVLRVHQQSLADSPARPERWRIAMRHPVTKYAVAAVVVVTALIGFSLFRRTSGVTWALEQSIDALSQYRALLIEGTDTERTWREDGGLEPKPSRSWAVANADQTGVEKFRTEFDGVPLLVTNGRKTWRYDRKTNTVRVENRPYVASECWFGSRFLEQLKRARDAGWLTEYRETRDRDPATGRLRILVTCAWEDGRYNGPRSVRIEFDPQNKLPTSFQQWENSRREGPASLSVERITYYESLPDELFEFQIPPGAKVVEQ